MSERQRDETSILNGGQTILVTSVDIPKQRGGASLARVPLEWLKKYSSPKPVRRPPPRPKRTEEESQ